MRPKVRLAYITVSMPTGLGEAFLIEEALELQRRVDEILLVPRSPSSIGVNQDATPLLLKAAIVNPLGLKTLFAFALELLDSPLRLPTTVLPILFQGSLATRLKNLVTIPKAVWFARLARARGITHIHCHWAATTSTVGLIASKLTDIPWSMTLHRGDIVANNLLAKKLASASFARFVSQSGIELARAVAPESDLARARVIPMGVRPESLRVAGTLPPAPKVILCPANLLPVKGHSYLIDAMRPVSAAIKDVELWLAGEGPLRPQLVRQVDALGLHSRVRFLGHVDHYQLIEFYRNRSIGLVVLPSVNLGNGEQEGIPVSLIEAMSFGVPVVSTLSGGIPELLAGGAGVLVAEKSASELAKALIEVLSNEERHRQLSGAVRRRALEKYSIETVCDTLVNYIVDASIEPVPGNEVVRKGVAL